MGTGKHLSVVPLSEEEKWDAVESVPAVHGRGVVGEAETRELGLDVRRG